MSIENAISQLKNLMGDRLSVSMSERRQYGQNETYYKEMLPDAVAYPKDEKEVSEILQVCNNNKCPIIPWGTGTSLEGKFNSCKWWHNFILRKYEKYIKRQCR